ncbi:hypothetical protein FOZ62_008457, partial [Perkinsus olseni]
IIIIRFTFITAHTEAGPAAAAHHHHTHSTASANTVRYHHYDGHPTLAEGSRGESAAKRDGYQQDEADANDTKPPSSSSFTTRRDAGGIQAGFAGLKSRMSEVFSSRPSEWCRRGSLNKQGRPSTRHSRSTSALISEGQHDDDENMDVCGGQDHDFDDDDDDDDDATDGFCNGDKNGNENIFRQWWDAAASSSPLTKARRRRRRTTTFVNKANDDDKGVW